MAGFCAQAAVRRTPVLLDGVVVTAAALVADRLAPGARAVVAGGTPVHRTGAHARAEAPRARTDHRHADAARRGHRRRGRACPSCAPPSPRSRRWPRSTRRASPRDPLGHRRIRVRDRPARARLRPAWAAVSSPHCLSWASHSGRWRAPWSWASSWAFGARRPARRRPRGRGPADRDPRPAHRRAVRHRRRARLLRAAGAGTAGDARRFGGPLRRGRRGGGDPAAGAGVRGPGRGRSDRRGDRGPGGRGGGVPAVGASRAGQLAGCDAPRAPSRPRWCWRGSWPSRRWPVLADPRRWQGPLAVLVALASRRCARSRTASAGSAESPATCWAPRSR